MATFRKRPVVIEAIQFRPDNWNEVSDWLDKVGYGAGSSNPVKGIMLRTDRGVLEPDDRVPEFSALLVDSEPGLLVTTLEGPHYARHGDWLICGSGGEVYPCKPDLFEIYYEAVVSASFNPPALTPYGWATLFLRYGYHRADCALAATAQPCDGTSLCTCGYKQAADQARIEAGSGA